MNLSRSAFVLTFLYIFLFYELQAAIGQYFYYSRFTLRVESCSLRRTLAELFQVRRDPRSRVLPAWCALLRLDWRGLVAVEAVPANTAPL